MIPKSIMLALMGPCLRLSLVLCQLRLKKNLTQMKVNDKRSCQIMFCTLNSTYKVISNKIQKSLVSLHHAKHSRNKLDLLTWKKHPVKQMEVKVSPGTLSVSCSSERLLEKNGLSEGLGVDEMLIVSISGPESLRSSSSSNRSSISVGSTSPPEHTKHNLSGLNVL